MKKSMKISKKTIKVLSILFLAIVSSLFFTSNVKAIYYDKGNGKEAIYSTTKKNLDNKVGDTYTYKINNEDFNETIKLEYKQDGLYFSSDYVSNVPVFQSSNTSLVLNSAFVLVFTPEYNQMIVYLFYKENMPKDVYFINVTYNSDNKFDFYSDGVFISTSSTTRIKFMYNSNHTYSSNTSITNNTYNLLNWSVYGSNVSISTLNGYYSEYPDSKEPTIDFTYNNNITTINDTNYITSKDVTMIVDNYDSNTQLLQYQFVKNGENLTDNWITHTFANNENTLTLNFKENGSLITRILDIEDNYNIIYSHTYAFDDITLFHNSIKIDTSNLGYIKVNFDLTNFNDDDFEYTRLLNVSSRLKEAYIHQTYADSCVGSSCMDIFYARDNLEFSNLLNSYTSHSIFQINRTYILTDFYIYYDVSDISDTLTLNIDSTKPFDIEYGYLDDYVDNSITLNLKGYRGLVLYPKVSNYDGNYPFYLNNVDINIFEYNKNTLIDYYNNITSDIYYINNIKNYQKTRYYLLQNNKLNEDSYITFDTRYFNYQYVSSDEEDIVIENPNSGFNTTIPSINESDFQKDYLNVLGDNDFHSIIDYMRSLLDDLQETSDAFNDIFHSFYDNLPSIVQVGLVCGYTLLLIIISLKLGGWNLTK